MERIRRALPALLLALALLLSGCGGQGAAKTKRGTEVLLLAPETADGTPELVAQAVEAALAGQDVRCALTDSAGLSDALARAAGDGVRVLAVQPLWLLGGDAYASLYDDLARQAADFDAVALGTPLLTADEDYAAAAQALAALAAAEDDGRTAFVFAAEGGAGEDAYVFGLLQQTLRQGGCESCFIGAPDAEPTPEDVVTAVRGGGFARAVVFPLAVFADGPVGPDWQSALEAAGCETEARGEGLAALEPIRGLLVRHALDTLAWAREAANQ